MTEDLYKKRVRSLAPSQLRIHLRRLLRKQQASCLQTWRMQHKLDAMTNSLGKAAAIRLFVSTLSTQMYGSVYVAFKSMVMGLKEIRSSDTQQTSMNLMEVILDALVKKDKSAALKAIHQLKTPEHRQMMTSLLAFFDDKQEEEANFSKRMLEKASKALRSVFMRMMRGQVAMLIDVWRGKLTECIARRSTEQFRNRALRELRAVMVRIIKGHLAMRLEIWHTNQKLAALASTDLMRAMHETIKSAFGVIGRHNAVLVPRLRMWHRNMHRSMQALHEKTAFLRRRSRVEAQTEAYSES